MTVSKYKTLFRIERFYERIEYRACIKFWTSGTPPPHARLHLNYSNYLISPCPFPVKNSHMCSPQEEASPAIEALKVVGDPLGKMAATLVEVSTIRLPSPLHPFSLKLTWPHIFLFPLCDEARNKSICNNTCNRSFFLPQSPPIRCLRCRRYIYERDLRTNVLRLF